MIMRTRYRKPQQTNDSIMEDAGSVYHYRNGELVGITVPNASEKNPT